MRQDQYLMLVRMLLQMGGTVLVAQGVFTAADWTSVADNTMTFVGAGTALWGVGWALWSRRESALKAVVANMPGTVVVNTAGNPAVAATAIAQLPQVNLVQAGSDAIAAPSPKVVP
jgi:hypothetical protein